MKTIEIMNKKLLVPLIVLIGLVILTYYFGSGNGGKSDPQKEIADYKNATYEIDGSHVTLVNGLAEKEIVPGSASKLITKYFGNDAQGDLNDDGKTDTVFLLTQTGGGSGTFYYVVAALKTTNGYEGTNAVLLGDRISPQTTEIRNGKIIVNYADRDPEEPITAEPSMGISKFLKIENGQLVVGLEQ